MAATLSLADPGIFPPVLDSFRFWLSWGDKMENSFLITVKLATLQLHST